MPRPIQTSHSYLPGLDGLRAVSVIAVVGYHLQVPYMEGGLLGVGMFFTLSGYLITSILLREWRDRGRIDLKNFWLRRARRLLPAVILLLVAVVAATAVAEPEELGTRLFESGAAMLYVSNWTTIASGVSYFDNFSGPGPLDHLWSLAIEEQFYVIWPLLLLALLRWLRPLLIVIVSVLAALSFAWMAELAVLGFDNTRAYEGTDTRAGEILVGVALAVILADRRHRGDDGHRLTPYAVDVVGVAGLGVIVWLFATTNPYSVSLYRGGLLTLSLATVAVLAAVVHPRSQLTRVLGIAPLRWVGERSYGIYLWHLPLVAFTPESFYEDQPVLRGALLAAATLAIADLSWSLYEDPIRRHGVLGALRIGDRSGDTLGRRLAYRTAGATAWIFVVVVGAATLSACALVAVDLQTKVEALTTGDHQTAFPVLRSEAIATLPTTPPTTEDPGPAADPSPGEVLLLAPTSTTSSTLPPAPVQPLTSCREVTHIGDSTSLGLNSELVLPGPNDRIDARYQAMGAEVVDTDILGARSIVERYKNQPNAEDAVAARIDAGYQGCWVFFLGTNDAANISVGGPYSHDERIMLLMSRIGDSPALWLRQRTLKSRGPWADSEMTKWNDALDRVCARYPNMRVYDWAGEVQDDWFDHDGIHFSAEGNQELARRTAHALAVAFPLEADQPTGCIVNTPEVPVVEPEVDLG